MCGVRLLRDGVRLLRDNQRDRTETMLLFETALKRTLLNSIKRTTSFANIIWSVEVLIGEAESRCLCKNFNIKKTGGSKNVAQKRRDTFFGSVIILLE
jgi:hypothetical protein